MSNFLVTDARYHITPGCPVDVDVMEADEQVEVVIGAQRVPGDAVRLVTSDPEVCYQLAAGLLLAQRLLLQVIEDNNKGGPALSQMDTTDTLRQRSGMSSGAA